MKKFLASIVTLLVFLLPSLGLGQPVPQRGRLIIEEIDGAPTGAPYKLKVSNGALTDNGDGTFT